MTQAPEPLGPVNKCSRTRLCRRARIRRYSLALRACRLRTAVAGSVLPRLKNAAAEIVHRLVIRIRSASAATPLDGVENPGRWVGQIAHPLQASEEIVVAGGLRVITSAVAVVVAIAAPEEARVAESTWNWVLYLAPAVWDETYPGCGTLFGQAATLVSGCFCCTPLAVQQAVSGS